MEFAGRPFVVDYPPLAMFLWRWSYWAVTRGQTGLDPPEVRNVAVKLPAVLGDIAAVAVLLWALGAAGPGPGRRLLGRAGVVAAQRDPGLPRRRLCPAGRGGAHRRRPRAGRMGGGVAGRRLPDQADGGGRGPRGGGGPAVARRPPRAPDRPRRGRRDARAVRARGHARRGRRPRLPHPLPGDAFRRVPEPVVDPGPRPRRGAPGRGPRRPGAVRPPRRVPFPAATDRRRAVRGGRGLHRVAAVARARSRPRGARGRGPRLLLRDAGRGRAREPRPPGVPAPVLHRPGLAAAARW